MATVEEERAKVKLGTSGGSIYTPGTPTMRAAGAMNADVATALRGAVAANPQMNYAAGAGQGIRQAYAEGGVPQAIGKTLAATVAAPYAIAKDTFSGVARDVGAFGSGVAKGMGFQVGDGGVTTPSHGAAAQPQAPVASPQIQTVTSHGAGIRTAAQPQAPVEEGGGMIRDSQTGEVVRMDPAGNISRFDSTGAPISKLSPRQWGGGAQQAPAARGLTTTFADGTTEFTPASTEQAPPVWGLRPAAQEQAGAGGGYAPREIKTWGDWMTEKKERAAYGLNTQRMTAEAGAIKQLADAQQVAPEGASIRGLRAAQAGLAGVQAEDIPAKRTQTDRYYDILEKGATAKAAGATGLKPFSVEKETIGKEGISKIKRQGYWDPATNSVVYPEDIQGGAAPTFDSATQEAKAAVARGADPALVVKRLQEFFPDQAKDITAKQLM